MRARFWRTSSGHSQYDVIEIMACPGGCINGGGQPYTTRPAGHDPTAHAGAVQHRRAVGRRKSHENPSIIKLYEEFLGEPGSQAHELLHTEY
jgi:iron only hydrogenase large subunit-like protein